MVKIPYNYHSNDQLLVWLAARYKEGQKYQSWSDYDKQIMENQIVGQMIRGVEQGASHWSSHIFGEEKTMTHAANSLGMIQETTADKTYRSFDIAHRYQLAGNISGNRWQIIEDGAFTEEGVLVRNLRFQTHRASRAGLEYQLNHFYKGHQAHSVKLQKDDANFLHYQTAMDAERNRQQAEIYLSNQQYHLHPGYSWSNNSSANQQFINAGINHMTMSLWRNESATGQQYYQSFAGYGQNWSANLEGAQDSDDRQLYKQAMFLRFPGQFNFAQQVNLRKNDIWQISRFYSQLYWQAFKSQFSSFVNYFNQQWFQGISVNANTKSGYLGGYIDLHNLRFDKNNEARISYFKQLKNGLGITSHASYRYRETGNRFNTAYQQNLYIPLSLRIFIQPMAQLDYPSDDPLKWIGSGFGYSSDNYFYGQILTQTDNNTERIIDVQLAYQTSSLLLKIPLDAWLHMQQLADQIQWIEIRLLSGSSDMQPGIYYSYDRYTGIRWEGYLQWRW